MGIQARDVTGQLFLKATHDRVLQALLQAEYLSPKYHVVIANPPYMGGKGMNGRLGAWAKENYPDSKADLFAMFMERSLSMSQKRGMLAMINMQSWMFLGTFEKLRNKILSNSTILTMAHIGERGFDTIGGAVVSTTAFVLQHAQHINLDGIYIRLTDGKSESEKSSIFLDAVRSNDNSWKHSASTVTFEKIYGKPIAYWLSDRFQEVFESARRINDYADPCAGLQTSDNNRFLRLWHEVGADKTQHGCSSRDDASQSNGKWFPCTKGGGFRRWYGLNEYLVNWENDGAELFEFASSLYGSATRIIKNASRYFESGLTWSSIAPKFSIRYCPIGFIFETKGSMCFPHELEDTYPLLALLNSKIVEAALEVFSPTFDFHEGPLGRVPAVFEEYREEAKTRSERAVGLSRNDWDTYETSWDFTSLPLLNPDYLQPTLKGTYQKLRAHWREMTLEMKRLEEENNRIFIDAYGLQDELKPEVQLNEITLTCNPHYRYGNDRSEDELEALLLADTMRELVSYAVGCMFGRYALDEPGLILANQGETIDDYLKQIPESSFPADDDNVIPMLDGDWFTDDIAERFRKFLRVTFGEAHYEENLQFVEQALNIKGKRNYGIRDYFLGEFYTDHVKRYKKRPIYWLFSSPKGSFNALIYMHRYRPDTVSVVLNDYLREFRTKLTARKNHLEAVSVSASASQGEKTKALKEIDKLNRMIQEMEEYERDVLYPLATEQVEIDLDDGVKVNYNKFGVALKKITGLSGK
jgi:type II restriction/modification system DNA methylase subunit YeeA